MWFGEFAPLYFAGGQLGLSRAEVDDYEVWEFAAVIGRHLPPRPETPSAPVAPTAPGVPAPHPTAPPGEWDPLRARMAAQRLGLAPPVPPPSAPPAPGITTLRPNREQRGA